MASSSAISDNHRAALDKLKAELGSGAESGLGDDVKMAYSNVNAQPSQATTRACMLNDGVGTITLHDYKDWSGKVFGSYPPSIPMTRSGKSTHRGVPPKDSQGSMGAVVYVGSNVQGQPNNCAWVLAWWVAGDGSSNKIYVETGPCSKYPKNKIDWDSIKDKLMNSINESNHRDDDTGAEASAKIDETGNIPACAAVFDVTL
ncbi:jasmonate-induced protein homolog [Amaranthus tricolor]|uniref:jasmonate-induced protein homolog n=1 Tax=Amaranthus tricolor TaxID=29722 RepID=UPI002588E5F9|nr:jasmonate-induced protein homolog [Amaranthus tricolor]XP_057542886.1 jasmonate-induced protein homolog [Amaranthus tricolor]